MIHTVNSMEPISLEGITIQPESPAESISKELQTYITDYQQKLNVIMKQEQRIKSTQEAYEAFGNFLNDFLLNALKLTNSNAGLLLILGFISQVLNNFNLSLKIYLKAYSPPINLSDFINDFLDQTIANINTLSKDFHDSYITLEQIITEYKSELFTQEYNNKFKQFLAALYKYKLFIMKTEEEIKFYLETYRQSTKVLSLGHMKSNTDAIKQFKLKIGLLDESPDRTQEMIEKMAELFSFYEEGQFKTLKSNLDMLIDTIQKLLFPSSITGGNFKRKAVKKLLKKYK